MKILSIIAQKPSSTGSGVYLTELVKCFSKKGFTQEVICAAYNNDDLYNLSRINSVTINPIFFDTKDLPFHIVGMSDVMPYESLRYIDLASDKEKLALWKEIFSKKIKEVTDRFKPDLIICHHLYLLTALTRDICKNAKIYGICHNTDLRQYQQTDLCREYIKKNIMLLDMVFAPSEEHKNKAIELFELDEKKVKIIGIGYNSEIFRNIGIDYEKKKNKILYVGKIAKKKGVLSLIKAFNLINDKKLTLDLIGGTSDKDEYEEIVNEAKMKSLNINFINPMSQSDLAIEYNNHELFVLPSFSEGIPMVPIEAMACGCKVVISDLPGVKNFYRENIGNAIVDYVKLPIMSNVDNASDEELKDFEKRLVNSIQSILPHELNLNVNLTNLSWENIVNKILVAPF